jgi:hypothetical protein
MRALVAYSSSSTFVQTTLEYLTSFKKYSGFETDYVHVTNGAEIGFELEGYDLVFHNYCARLCFDDYVSDSYRDKIRNFQGIKIISIQDEYDQTNVLKAAIKDLGFDLVLTCVPQDSLEYVYPRTEFPNVTFITVFTGYVSDDFASNRSTLTPLAERPITIGYRGRDIGGRYGRLGFDKFEIGRRMKEICAARGIEHDIAMDEASRIYGMAWFEFLSSCRVMLGTESGSNVFDFTGDIERKFKAMTQANDGVRPSYEQIRPLVSRRDSEIDMGQISPRVFECALMRTPMLLFRGRYSDAIEPDVHYIALEKDFSNIDVVLERLEDIPALEAMAQRAYEHLVSSGQFSYRRFFGMVGAEARRRIGTRRTRKIPIAPVAEGSFKLNGHRAVELASTGPDSLDGFMVRANLQPTANLVLAVATLERKFDQIAKNYSGGINKLLTEISERANDVRLTFGLVTEERLETAKCKTGKLEMFLASTAVEDEHWRSKLGNRLDSLLRDQGLVVPAASYGDLRRAHQELVDRYSQIGQRFERLNTLYDSESLLLEASLRSVMKIGMDAALHDVAGRWNLNKRTFFILRWVLIQSAQKARSSVRSIWQIVEFRMQYAFRNVKKITWRLRKIIARNVT